MCRCYKSGNRCIHGNNCLCRHADGEEKSSKRSKSDTTQGAVAILKKSPRMCISKFRSKEVYSAEGQTRLTASAGRAIKNSQDAPGTKFRFGKEKGHLEASSKKGEPHERNPCAPKFEERTPEEASRQEEYARKAAWKLARKVKKLKAVDKATFYSPVEIRAPVLDSRNTEERMFVVDPGCTC